MIKAQAITEQGIVLVLGLSHENLRKLKDEDMPIRFEGKEIGLPVIKSVFIFAGKDEATMQQMLKDNGFIGPDTRVFD